MGALERLSGEWGGGVGTAGGQVFILGAICSDVMVITIIQSLTNHELIVGNYTVYHAGSYALFDIVCRNFDIFLVR